MNAYEMAIKTTKREYFVASIATSTHQLRQSRLNLNPQKTEVLWVGNKKPSDVKIHLAQLDGTTLTISTTVKSLM